MMRNGVLHRLAVITVVDCLVFLLPAFVIGVGSAWLPFFGLFAILNDIRLWYDEPTALLDSLIFASCFLWLWRTSAYASFASNWSQNHFIKAQWQPLSSILFSSIIFATLSSLAASFFIRKSSSTRAEARQDRSAVRSAVPFAGGNWYPLQEDGAADSSLPSHVKPLIFPCRTKHARIFPKRHAFDHSYLQVGIPITRSSGKRSALLSAEVEPTLWKWSKGLLQVRAEDHLERGYAEVGLEWKLRVTLRDQGVQDHEWQYAYLVTAPRFLGYSFNPVSFWYIYDRDQDLKMMILEVNNTFGERRIYLLRAMQDSEVMQPQSEPGANGPRSKVFANVWQKDFHVSPFNSRKGSYTLKATDPFGFKDSFAVDNTITLKSSKDHAKLVARLFSTSEPLDPASMSTWQILQFVLSWWWVGLVTFPRILVEATKLFFRRKLHVWFRPEVMMTGIGRAATATEIILERFFSGYLQYLVDQATEHGSLRLTYRAAINSMQPKEFTTSYGRGRTLPQRHLEIRVLTPAFYSRFAHYAHTCEAFDRESLCTDERNRTLWISDPGLLSILLQKPRAEDCPSKLSFLDRMRWNLLRKLRCPPSAPVYPLTPQTSKAKDIRYLPFSALDRFVMKRWPSHGSEATVYRRNVTRVFLAQRFALGFQGLVDAADILLRVLVIYSSLGSLSLADLQGGFGEMEPRYVALGFVFCIPHVYALVKGFR